MDLLRSVLVRQPLEKLTKLHASERFYRFRKDLIIPEADDLQEVSMLELFCLHGELTGDLPEIIHPEVARAITVFLDDYQLYQIYPKKRGENLFVYRGFSGEIKPLSIYRTSAFLCYYAVKTRRFKLFTDLRKLGYPWDALVCAEAALQGNLLFLQSVRDKGCPWDEWTCANAARGGHLEILKWAKSQDCPWNHLTTSNAVKFGHLNILIWAVQHGLAFNTSDIALAAKAGNLQMLEFMYSSDEILVKVSAFTPTALGGNITVMEWLLSKDCDYDEFTTAAAAEGGHLQALQWLRKKGCPWDQKTCNAAAKNGHLHILQWARSENCDWSENTCSNAAKGGHLHILEWLRANHCPWNLWTCITAAAAGHLHILQWARENGCQWSSEVCDYAAQNGHLHVLQWAVANGCPATSTVCSFSAVNGHLEVFEWAVNNICKPDINSQYIWLNSAFRNERIFIIKWLTHDDAKILIDVLTSQKSDHRTVEDIYSLFRDVNLSFAQYGYSLGLVK